MKLKIGLTLMLCLMALPVVAADFTVQFTLDNWGAGVQVETKTLFTTDMPLLPCAKWEPLEAKFKFTSSNLQWVSICPLITAVSTKRQPALGGAGHFADYAAVGVCWDNRSQWFYFSSAKPVEWILKILGYGR